MFNIAESFPCNMDTREAATKKETLIRLTRYMMQFISVNFLFPLFCGMVMYANEFETRKNKNKLK